MTQEQFEAKFKETLERAQESIYRKGIELFRCGGIDPQKYEDNYRLPKIILAASLKHEAEGWAWPDDRRAIHNLMHF